AALRLNRLQRLQRLERFGWIDHRRRMGHATQIAHHHAEAMVERDRDAHARTTLDSRRLSHEEGIVDQIVMRERRPLRQAGGAAGELDIYGIIHLDGGRYRVEPPVADLLASFRYPIERQAAVVLPRN